MRKDKEDDVLKKRIILGALSLFVLLFMSGCGQDEKSTKENVNIKTVFSKEDITKTTEMIAFLETKMEEFQMKATQSIESGEIKLNKDDELKETLNEMAKSMVLTPFLEQFPNSIVGEKSVVSFESTSSEPCQFGNCNYDGIAVPIINYEVSDYSIYTSKEFKVSQLIYNDVTSKFNSEDDEMEKAHLRFVKSENGDLIMTSSPFILNDSLYVDEWDQEFASIKSDVPESEVKAEEEEFRQEVEEVLAKYPPLQ